MRVCCLLALAVIQLAFAAEIGLNLPCNKELDGLLASDPDPTAFLSCVGVGVGKIGFWERKVCPNNMVFDFINQQCKAKSSKSKKSRKQQTLHIAILNNSCANGETCIGGTVCDLDTYRCLCPYGTVPQLDTLSCIKKDNNNYGETPTYGFNSYNNFENTVNGFSNTRTPDFLKPNPTYSKSTSDYNGNNFNYKNNFGPQDYSSQWKPNPDAGNSFLPNHKFIFQNLFSTTPAPTTTRKIPILAHPGQSCRQNEICSGGSICTLPIGLCLCPGELEARDGECVLPASASITVQKVGIGALCNELAECDHGATCVMGRCACVAPLVQHEGKCALRQERKEVGPGELCDNGEVCVRGSVCDVVIPVCVCPPETDLSNGECVHTVVTAAPKIAPVAPIAPVVPTYVNAARVSYTPAPAPAVVTYTPPPSGSPRTYTYVPRTTQSPAYRPATNPPTQPIINIHPTYVPPTRPLPQTKAQTFNYMSIATTTPTSASAQQTVKPNVMKIALDFEPVQPFEQPRYLRQNYFSGGSKQAGVGVRCALNTDCMIGAYCNGNTNPPSCQCLSTHVNIEGRCEKVVYPGQIGCRSDQQCTAAYAGTSCIDRVCVCPTGFKAVDQTCVPEFANPGEECGFSFTDYPLCRDGSVCLMGRCQCPSHTLLTNGRCQSQDCVPACIAPQECVNGACICPDGMSCTNPRVLLTRSKRASQLICWPGATSCSDGKGVCVHGTCHCLNGWTIQNGSCKPIPTRIGGLCDESSICENGSQCIRGFCKSTGLSRTEASCLDDSDCSLPMTCIRNRCQCAEGDTYENGKCVHFVVAVVYKPINSACSASDRCSGGSICKDSVCSCVNGSEEENDRCRQTPGGRCSNGETCINDSHCEFGVCQCANGHKEENKKCVVSLAKPGQSCQQGEKCIHNSSCRFGVCMCLNKKLAAGGRCIRREALVAHSFGTSLPSPPPATTTTIMTSLSKQSTAQLEEPQNTTTNSMKNHRPSIGGAARGPGMACTERDLCTGGSRCVEGMCACEEHEIIISTQCVGSHEEAVKLVDTLAVAAPGQACTEKTNCTGGSSCIDRVCQCATGVIGESGMCQELNDSYMVAASPTKQIAIETYPGALCTLSMDCPFRTECVRGVCRCRKGETIVDGMCRSAIHQVSPGARCDPRRGYDCIGEARCIYGVCTCTHHLMSNGKQCVTSSELSMVPPGQRCHPQQVCSGGSRCMQGYCRCLEGDVADVNGKCVKRGTVYSVSKQQITETTPTTYTSPYEYVPTLGEVCNTHCKDAVCVNNRCVTEVDASFQSHINKMEELELEIKNNPSMTLAETTANQQMQQVLYGYSCSSDGDCPANSQCRSMYCHCSPGYRATGGYCERIVVVGDECVSTNQCETNAFCLQGRCVCSSRDGTSCSTPQLARPGDSCIEGKICSYNSYCGIMSGVCECPSGMASTDGRCEQTATRPGIACVTSRNCHRYSYCDNGYCLCKTGYELVNGFCIPLARGSTDISREEQAIGTSTMDYRNDGPQSPMQERIRTESYVGINSVMQTTSIPHVDPYHNNGYNGYSGNSENYHNSFLENIGGAYGDMMRGSTRSYTQTQTPVIPLQTTTPPPQIEYPNTNLIDQRNQIMNQIANSAVAQLPNSEMSQLQTSLNSQFPNPNMIQQQQLFPYSMPFKPFPYVKGSVTKDLDEQDKKIRISMPGEHCSAASICLGNSVCHGNFCRCPQGTSAENGICTIRKQLHPARKAHDTNSIDDSKEERQFAAPLENCQNFEFCTGGAECLNIHGMGLICQCPVGKIFLEEECIDVPQKVDLSGIGDHCLNGEVCLGGSHCVQGICVCDGGKREILGICVTTASAGDGCGTGEICVDGAICSGQDRTCVCPAGKGNKEGRCVEDDGKESTKFSRNPGESCDVHSVCMDNSLCNGDGICQCQPKFFNVNGRCVPDSMVRPPNAECQPGTICASGSHCRQGICQCDPNHVLIDGMCAEVSNKIARKPAKRICSGDQDCPPHFRCIGQLCVCHGPSFECLSPMLLHADGSCLSDQQCPRHSSCQEGICVCNDGYKIMGDACLLRRRMTAKMFGGRVLDGDVAESAEENEVDYEESDEVIEVNPGSSCLENRVCVDSAICFNDHCICSYEEMPVDDRCLPRDLHVRRGQRCSESHRCAADLECLFGKCACVTNNCDPNEPVTSPPGGSCAEARECTGGSVCREGWCICPDPTMIVQKGICIQSGPRPTLPAKTVPVYTTRQPSVYSSSSNLPTYNSISQSVPSRKIAAGSSCGPLDMCVGGSTCIEGTCVCPATLTPINGRCELITTTTTVAPKVSAAPSWSRTTTNRRPTDFIELPTHAPLTRTSNECEAVGLYCRGNTICINRSCQCPEGYILHNDGCVPPSEISKRKVRGKARHQVTPSYARPGETCQDGRICTGGSSCSDNKNCECPSDKPLIKGEHCHPPETKKKALPGESCDESVECTNNSKCNSGQCRCEPQFIAWSGQCIAVPMPTTPKMTTVAKPLENCEEGEVCTGGSSCDEDRGICMCPPGQIAFSGECKAPPSMTLTSASASSTVDNSPATNRPTTECENDSNCAPGKLCISGKCRCRPGTVDNAGICEPLEEMEVGERPVPISYARHRALSSERLTASESEANTEAPSTEPPTTTTEEPTTRPPTRAPSRQATQRPRIVGPPIRRPKPKTKSGGSSGGSGGGTGPGSYKTGGTGAGNCPPGNEPTRDDGGKLIMCNGLEPNCPPRSYCYITSGGFATEEYNCLLRPKQLTYGQPCDRYADRCTRGSKCLENVCKCAPGFALSPSGWCERFEWQQKTAETATTTANTPPIPTAEPAIPARPAWPDRSQTTPKAVIFHPTNDLRNNYMNPNPRTTTTSPPPTTTASTTRPTMPRTTTWERTTRPTWAYTTPYSTHAPSLVTATAAARGPRIRGRPVGASCRDTDICLYGSSCIDDKCQCPSSMILKEGKCTLPHMSRPGESCRNGEQCIGGSICENDNKKCVCAARHVVVDGVCKSKDSANFSPPGGECTTGQECAGASSCIDGICSCDGHHYAEDGYCRHIASRSSPIRHDHGGALRFSSMAAPRKPATPCNIETCRLPDCFCTETGRKPPLASPIEDVPQFVVLTFDDAVNGRTMPDYLELFEEVKYRNPNGCPIKGTFFISHEWTNYDAVQWLYSQGMELASNSISHVALSEEDSNRWLNEMEGQRRIIAKFSNAFEEEIIGIRAPQLAAGGDSQFEMMMRAGFTYDNTLSANPGIHGEPFWPQTMDHQVPWDCMEENCPTGSFPGIWEIPLNHFYGTYLPQIDSYRRSSMIRAAVDLNNTVDQLTSMLLANFDRAYTTNKAPFVLSLNADFLQLNGKGNGMAALNRFLSEIMQHKDVFVVTMHQLVEWLKNPLDMTQIHLSDSLRCAKMQFRQNPGGPSTCLKPNKCMYRTPDLNSQEHQFKTCSPCPDVFPWLDNPVGDSGRMI